MPLHVCKMKAIGHAHCWLEYSVAISESWHSTILLFTWQSQLWANNYCCNNHKVSFVFKLLYLQTFSLHIIACSCSSWKCR